MQTEETPMEAQFKLARMTSLASKLEEVEIKFKIPGNLENIVPQICGELTEFIPTNMTPYPESYGLFFVKAPLRKGFVHRYWFIVDNKEVLDPDQPQSYNKDFKMTNTVFVIEEKMDALFKAKSYVAPSMTEYLKDMTHVKVI